MNPSYVLARIELIAYVQINNQSHAQINPLEYASSVMINH